MLISPPLSALVKCARNVGVKKAAENLSSWSFSETSRNEMLSDSFDLSGAHVFLHITDIRSHNRGPD